MPQPIFQTHMNFQKKTGLQYFIQDVENVMDNPLKARPAKRLKQQISELADVFNDQAESYGVKNHKNPFIAIQYEQIRLTLNSFKDVQVQKPKHSKHIIINERTWPKGDDCQSFNDFIASQHRDMCQTPYTKAHAKQEKSENLASSFFGFATNSPFCNMFLRDVMCIYIVPGCR